MPDISADLVTLAGLPSRPLRPEDAAAALGVDVHEVEKLGAALVAAGTLGFRKVGFVVGPAFQRPAESESVRLGSR